MGARNRVGIVISYRPASLCSLASRFQTLLLESIPSLIAEAEFVNFKGAQESIPSLMYRPARLHNLEELILGLFKGYKYGLWT
jgi:hypothetical protein